MRTSTSRETIGHATSATGKIPRAASRTHSSDGMAVSTTLYVSNLPASATEESLAGKFGRFGTVVSVSLSQDLATSRMRRGSIEMQTVEQARHAMNGLNF